MFTNKFELFSTLSDRIDALRASLPEYRRGNKTGIVAKIGHADFRRLKDNDWMSLTVFETHVEDLPEAERDNYFKHWDTLERHLEADRWFASIRSNQDLKLVFEKVNPDQRGGAWFAERAQYWRTAETSYWQELALALLRSFKIKDWPTQKDIDSVLQIALAGPRFEAGELAALRNAVILSLGLFDRNRRGTRSERTVLLSAIYYVVAYGGSTGHRPALFLAERLLDDLSRIYPGELHATRLLLDTRAILQSHAGRRSRKALLAAIALHADEIEIVDKVLADDGLAKDSGLLCRAGMAALINHLNLLIRAEERPKVIQETFVTWQRFENDVDRHAPDEMRASLKVDRDGPWRDPEHPKILANIKLVRPRRNISPLGGDPDAAAEIVQRVFDAHRVNPDLTPLERGDLGALLTEAQLSRYVRKQISKDRYIEVRSQTLNDYRQARLENMAQRVIQRMAPLEGAAGLSLATSAT